MKNKLFLSIALFLLGFTNAFAQKILDGQTLDLNGISVSLTITSKETVEIKGKNYERYKVSATAKNNSQKSFNKRESSYPNLFNKVPSIKLNCINATGLRLTPDYLELRPKSHIVKATMQTYDKSGKSISRSIDVTAGYFFDPGDTIENHDIFIVPAGEKPDFTVSNSL